MSSLAPRTLFILVDGLGLGSRDPQINPIYSGACPNLADVLVNHAVPVDAGMGIPGIPQSATGQTAIFTGVNAAAAVGRHVEGFPGPSLRDIIRKNNLYDKLAVLGYSSTFANAYYVSDMAEVESRKLQSVTTVSALKAFGRVRDRRMMEDHQAVYQDLTRESLRARGYEGPLWTPAQSARDLLAIAAGHDFTVFEYFQTDRAGHKGTWDEIRQVLHLFDEFLGVCLSFAQSAGHLFVLTSDHGNVEEFGSRTHSSNPVPLVSMGQGSAFLKDRVKAITDITPALVELYASSPKPPIRGADVEAGL